MTFLIFLCVTPKDDHSSKRKSYIYFAKIHCDINKCVQCAIEGKSFASMNKLPALNVNLQLNVLLALDLRVYVISRSSYGVSSKIVYSSD